MTEGAPQSQCGTLPPPHMDPERATHIQLGEQLFAEAIQLKSQGRQVPPCLYTRGRQL